MELRQLDILLPSPTKPSLSQLPENYWFRSQPLSQQIKLLEQELGIDLF